MADDVETVRPLELLHRAADMLGAVVCLTTNRDRRCNGRAINSADEGAQLQDLLVVQPAADRGRGRWHRLAAGTTLAQADIVDAVALDDVAQVLCEQLAPLLQRRAA